MADTMTGTSSARARLLGGSRSAGSRASEAPAATRLGALGRQRLAHGRRDGHVAVGLLGLRVGLFLVIGALDVDGPDVVAGAREDVVHGAHGAEHRVVGVVVAVQPVAADLLEVRD